MQIDNIAAVYNCTFAQFFTLLLLNCLKHANKIDIIKQSRKLSPLHCE